MTEDYKRDMDILNKYQQELEDIEVICIDTRECRYRYISSLYAHIFTNIAFPESKEAEAIIQYRKQIPKEIFVKSDFQYLYRNFVVDNSKKKIEQSEPKLISEVIDELKESKKYDNGKPNCGIVFGGFAKALLEVTKVGNFGIDKYGENTWQGIEQNRYVSALYRHLLAWQMGETNDNESNLTPLAHVAWNALAILQMELEKQNDVQK